MRMPYTYMTTKYFTLKTITKVNISKWLCDVQSTIFTILLLASYLIGMHYYLDYKVEKKINDPEFLIKLSTKVRPALIFDANETIQIKLTAKNASVHCGLSIKSYEMPKKEEGGVNLSNFLPSYYS